VLIGSGNPEEGELRPQLQDRFGLHVEVKTENDLEQRAEIVHRRELFERDPELFLREVESDQQRLRKKITQAQRRLVGVEIDRPLLRQIAQLCSELKVDGHRGELTIARAARALAVFEGRRKLSEEDVKRVALMSLRHRLRRDPLEEAGNTGRIERAIEKVFQQPRNKNRSQRSGETEDEWPSELDGEDIKPEFTARTARTSSPRGQMPDNSSERSLYPAIEVPGPIFRINEVGKKLNSRIGRNRNRQALGRRARVSKHGRYIRAVTQKEGESRLALDATLRAIAAAAYQKQAKGSLGQLTPKIPAEALRFKQWSSKRGTLFIFAIDTSGSMALNRIREAKGAIVRVLRQSYIRRDSVAIVAFGGGSAEVVLSPSRSIIRAKRALSSLAVGGATPLSTGVAVSVDLARRSSLNHDNIVLLLLTDGHANVSFHPDASNRITRQQLIASELSSLRRELESAEVTTVLIDTQKRFMAHTEAKEVARLLGASYTELDA
jgi:magnesium chelatase subunit D